VLGVTFWEGQPDLALIRQYLQEFVAQAGHLVASPPQAAVYEVTAEVLLGAFAVSDEGRTPPLRSGRFLARLGMTIGWGFCS
jgi:hypothetical protein